MSTSTSKRTTSGNNTKDSIRVRVRREGPLYKDMGQGYLDKNAHQIMSE